MKKKRTVPLYIPIVITSIAVIMLLVHLIFPDLKIDSVTVTLLIVAVAPWFMPYLSSLELPGGMKLEFNEKMFKETRKALREAIEEHKEDAEEHEESDVIAEVVGAAAPQPVPAAMAEGAEDLTKKKRSAQSESAEHITPEEDVMYYDDPILGLIGLIMELEEKIVLLGLKHKVSGTISDVKSILDELYEKEILSEDLKNSFINLVKVRNEAIKGIQIPEEYSTWILDNGDDILEIVDDLLEA